MVSIIGKLKKELKKKLKGYSFELEYIKPSYAKDGKTFLLVVDIPTPYYTNPTHFTFCHSNTDINKITMIYKTDANGRYFDHRNLKTLDEIIKIEEIQFNLTELVNHLAERVKEWSNWFN